MKMIDRIDHFRWTWSNKCDHVYSSERRKKNIQVKCLVNAKCRLHFKWSFQCNCININTFYWRVENNLYAANRFWAAMVNEMKTCFRCTFESDAVLLEFIVIDIIIANAFKYIRLIRWSKLCEKYVTFYCKLLLMVDDMVQGNHHVFSDLFMKVIRTSDRHSSSKDTHHWFVQLMAFSDEINWCMQQS